ncbi:MAG: alanine--tRNA ligase [Planctomycetes bacterium]|nr:alanine--tRNA ligase [Planctomycetota bacterium]
MKADELRRRYLAFFARRGHRVFPSDSLVPEGDASVLFTGAGMNQFKDAFLGKGPPDLKRAVSSQKCMRMPDLDNVGRTRSHHTFFEMLGNFSFGDYFKREAIAWAIEFLEQELALPRARLAVSVYLEDDEAAAIWEKEIGFPAARIWRYGEQDNFWPAEAPSKGPNGPCGPCSEIYFDFGPEASARRGLDSDPAGDGDRFVEIWNLVFTQFDRTGPNRLEPLPRKNIDTGAGLERLARVLQGKNNNFESDLFAPLIARIGDIVGRAYGTDALVDVRMKRIADHVRAAAFCISDGVRPGNEGRGYVVRKVIRRAAMDLRELGRGEPGLGDLVGTVAEVMGGAYPEIRERAALIRDTIAGEEARFAEVYRTGRARLEVLLEQAPGRRLSGRDAFFLWDTIGLPFDITRRCCEEQGCAVDEAEFEREMEEQRGRARAGSQIAEDIFGTGPASRLKGKVAPTEFLGYERLECAATVLAILGEDGALLEEAGAGSGAVSIVLDATPFYAESGGQVGDTGRLEAEGGAAAAILDTNKAEGYSLHRARIESGALAVGDRVKARADGARRGHVRRNHTATHLLHWALRRVLGAEASQAGSLVHPDYLRFDYTTGRAPSQEEIARIEELVNGQVLGDLRVSSREESQAKARAQGAIALFGEKYGDRVRMVRVHGEDSAAGQDSLELCGGTHCERTGQIGLFTIASDSAIASGVRRMVALTGWGALQAAQRRQRVVAELCDLLKGGEEDLAGRVRSLQEEKSRLEKELARGRRAAAAGSLDEIRAGGRDLGGGTLYVGALDDVRVEDLRSLADRLLQKDANGVALLASQEGGKVALVVACGPGALARGLKAGDLCRQIGQALGGGGGGRPNMAQGQGRDAAALPRALADAEQAVRRRWTSAPAG